MVFTETFLLPSWDFLSPEQMQDFMITPDKLIGVGSAQRKEERWGFSSTNEDLLTTFFSSHRLPKKTSKYARLRGKRWHGETNNVTSNRQLRN
ncbi:hypothetical protein TNCV_3092031 [Trichonephila clavipes]|uniref:Uncharacterized protein n=1 Tax=Trichonephila clavipes TaxID=2585209 RepID=A0A8X6V3R0_TRICX|nr:hypothetical protein TNCV_4361711 [Trichonephila clavipes]GFY03577.1 hypothetical protein TNCV_3092031 [Trichonephila clavipes]